MSGKITAEMVKELRERTGVGMGKCKEALDQTGGDMEKAIDYLRKAGIASAVKKEGRETKEGMIGVADSKNGIALVEVNTETDFVAQNEKFRTFVHSICHTACDKMPASLDQFLATPCQHDPSLTIDQYRALTIQALGENIQIKRLLVLPKKGDSSVAMYSHMAGKIVAVVVLSGGQGHEALAREIAMHVAAEAPDYLLPEEIPDAVKAREEEIARSQIQGKPAQIAEKIIEGKLKAFYDQVCLLHQKFIKDNTLTVAALVEKESKRIGKPLTLQAFYRWKVGE